MQSRLVSGTLVAALVAAAAWGCGGGGGGGSTPTGPSTSPPPPAATTVTVSVVGSSGNTAFQPNPVRAATGDTVMFRNSDRTLHRVVMDDGSANLGDIAPGATSRAFTVPQRQRAQLPLHAARVDGRQHQRRQRSGAAAV